MYSVLGSGAVSGLLTATTAMANPASKLSAGFVSEIRLREGDGSPGDERRKKGERMVGC
jgi:hypothetical protein